MNSATISLDNAGVRKAAILVASLERSAADALLDQLEPQQADLVRQAVMALDEIETEERQRVLDEFCRIGPMLPEESPAGIELDGPAAHYLGQTGMSAPLIQEQTGMSAPPPPFEFLSDAEHERLAHLLRGERPPTIALVLSHLPPRRAGEVLACFPPALGVERRSPPGRHREHRSPDRPRGRTGIGVALGAANGHRRGTGRWRTGGGGQDPRRLRSADARADSRQPRRGRSAAGRAVRSSRSSLRRPGPVRRRDDAGHPSSRRTGNDAGGAVRALRRPLSNDSSARCPRKKRSGGVLCSITRTRSD